MTNRDRVQAVLNFERPTDRMPILEWASWWDKTLKAWHAQGLPEELSGSALFAYLGLDDHKQFWLPDAVGEIPGDLNPAINPIRSEADYERIREYLYPERNITLAESILQGWKEGHEKGEYPVWISLDGGFWYPRKLFGITGHFYSFYDEPELYHRILEDLAEYQMKALEVMYAVLTPDFMTFAEDMSYNHGPMLSEKLFNEFLLPYYRKIIPFLREHGTKVLVDTDGDLSLMIPWLRNAGIQGALPLEHQAGVDVARIREAYPDFLMIGAYDKMVLRPNRHESEMRGEFERLLPVIRTGGFIASVDHQTPPDCPLDRYDRYVGLMREYAEKAVRI